MAHGSSSPTGASVAVVQHQFMLQVSDSTAQPTRSVHTNTHLSILELHCVIPLFGYVSLSGPPCVYNTQNSIKGKIKTPSGHRDHKVTIYRLCGGSAGAALNY